MHDACVSLVKLITDFLRDATAKDNQQKVVPWSNSLVYHACVGHICPSRIFFGMQPLKTSSKKFCAIGKLPIGWHTNIQVFSH